MRGSNTLYSDIFDPAAVSSQPKKGRNKELHSNRNECLIDRYFYYGKQQLSYAAILEKVSNEFFVSAKTIPYLIDDHIDQLKRLKEMQPHTSYFKKRWPHLTW